MTDPNPYAGTPVVANGQARNEDVRIHIVAPIDFPYHKWLAFSAAVSSNVVRLMKEHKLVEADK